MVKCLELQQPSRGSIRCSDPKGPSSYGSTCEFACNEGYTLVGSSTLQCGASGLWSSLQPLCVGMSASTEVKTQRDFTTWGEDCSVHTEVTLTSSVSPLYSRPVSCPSPAGERRHQLRRGRGHEVQLWKHLQLHLWPRLHFGRAERGDVHVSGRVEQSDASL